MKAPIERSPEINQDEIIVVKLWEVYLRQQSENLLKTLSHLSLDGPFENSNIKERLTFRFNRQTWEERVKGLLYENRVPVVIQSNPFYAVQFKGVSLERG